ncbi:MULTISPECIES: hypothetical protein [Halorussus]|uniref:hypothetical protein n=1 Tax=Halorussus TaxID=1070314 RepID=UPI0013B3D3C4|nr:MULTISPECIES: hypothetical protein [Halorussus]NHN57763.1 hypothetical protein [Halorussus sp. JP-T4]
MDVRRVALLLVALMVVVAGCAGSDAAPDAPAGADATPTATTSPADAPPDTGGERDAPSATTTAANATPNESRPPGVNRTGVEDPSALVDAHRAALNNTSFAFRFHANVSVGPANQWTRQRGAVEAGLSPLVVHSDSVRRLGDGRTRVATDLWANGTAVVVRYEGANRSELRRYNRTGESVADETWAHLPRADLDSQVTQAWLIELALAAGEFDVADVERRDGRTMTVLRADRAVSAENYTDFEAAVVVDAAGRVHSLSLTAAYAGDDETRIHYEFALTDVGDVTVERPTWVEAASPPTPRNETATTTGAAGSATTGTASGATTAASANGTTTPSTTATATRRTTAPTTADSG